MGKRKPAFDPRQHELSFEVPVRAAIDGELADLPRVTASLVSAILKADTRSRYEIAADMSRLLGEDVTKPMLDAYCSEAKDQHRIPFDRMLALVASTHRYELMAVVIRRIGAELLVGEEVKLAEIGQLQAEIREKQERLSRLKSEASPSRRRSK